MVSAVEEKKREIGPSICLITFKKINCTRDDYNTSIIIHTRNKIQKKNQDVYAKEPMSNLLISARECVSITNIKLILCISIQGIKSNSRTTQFSITILSGRL